MKTLKFIVIGMAMILSCTVQAQVSVNVTLPAPPMWGPVGYTGVQYYYLPDVESYYDVRTSMFIYYSGGVWVHRAHLPGMYANYDLYGGYKVVMRDYHGNTPYSNFKEYKMKYKKGYHGGAQRTIGERPGHGNQGPQHPPQGNPGNKNGGHNNGNGGHGNDKGDSHGHDKNSKDNHDQGGGNGEKK
jgi:hypothetical protein